MNWAGTLTGNTWSGWYNDSGTKKYRDFAAFSYVEFYEDYSPTQSLLYVGSVGCVKYTKATVAFVAKSTKYSSCSVNIAPANAASSFTFNKSGVEVDFGSSANAYVSYGGGLYLLFNKGTSEQTLVYSFNTVKGANYSGTHAWDGSSSGAGYFTIPVISDVISYDLQGGEGSIGSQTKKRGESITLSSVVPTKEYKQLLGWSLTAGKTSKGSGDYDIGGTFSENITQNTTLYAIWGDRNYNIKFYDDSTLLQTKASTHYVDFNFDNNVIVPTKNGYVFTGWSLTNGGSSSRYKDSIVSAGSYSSDTNYYACWAENYVSIQLDNANLRAYRCNESYTAQDDSGVRANLIASYTKGKSASCNATVASHNVVYTDIPITRAVVSVSLDNENWTEISSSIIENPTSNPITLNVHDDGTHSSLLLENAYYLRITLYDDANYSRFIKANTYISKGSFTMDVNTNGDSVSFFGVAPDNDTGLFIGDVKVRPIYISANAPTSADGEDGDVWLQYI